MRLPPPPCHLLLVVVLTRGRPQEDMRGIHIAAYYGYVEEMALLLKHGADVNRKITDSYTPLHYACFFANHGAARLLVAAGADPLFPDHEGSTPISLAVRKDDKELVEILRGGTAAAGGGAVD